MTPRDAAAPAVTTGASVDQAGQTRYPPTVPHPAADLPAVPGWVYGPHPGRRAYLILVRCCPHCECAHRHTSEVLASVYRRHCPVVGTGYVVRSRIERDTRRNR
jgi:hypothetical protein